jgi:peroxiredoxin
VELQGRLPEIRKSGLSLAAISYDPVSTLSDFAKRRGITFPPLSIRLERSSAATASSTPRSTRRT